MQKTLWILGVVLALTAGVAAPAFAAEGDPVLGPGGPGVVDGEGPLHDLLVQAAADLLGLEPGDLEARLAAGETVSQIALELGWDLQEFRLEWRQARLAVIEQAVEDGLIERAQVRWMAAGRARGMGVCAGLGAQGPAASPGQ